MSLLSDISEIAERFSTNPRPGVGAEAHALSRPKTLNIYVTDRCNLKCKMCNIGVHVAGKSDKLSIGRTWDHAGYAPDRLTEDDVRKLIRDIAAWDPNIPIYLSGGEPFIKKNLVFAILDEAQKWAIDIGMNSNAMLLDDRVADEVLRLGLVGITLSLDGIEGVHDDIRGVAGSYRRVKQAVAHLKEARARYGRPFNIFVLHAINPGNYTRMLEALEDLSTWGLEGINFSHYAFTSKEQIEKQQNGDYGRFGNGDATIGGIYTADGSYREMDIDILYEQVQAMRRFAAHLRGWNTRSEDG